MEMRTILVPHRDRILAEFPDNPEYHYGRNVEEFLKELPAVFRGWFNSFGKGSQTDPPTSQLRLEVKGDHSNIKEYEVVKAKLNDEFYRLESLGGELLPLLRDVRVWNKAGLDTIDNLIEHMNASAEQPPGPGMGEDNHILDYVTEAVEIGTKEMERTTTQLEGVAERLRKIAPTGDVDKGNPPDKPDKDVPKDPPPPERPPTGLPGQPPFGQYQPGPNSPTDLRPPAIDDPNNRPTNDSAVQDKINRAIDSLQNQASRTPPPVQPNAPSSPFGSGMGMDALGPMLGPMMNAARMREMADPYTNRRPPDLRRPEQNPPPPPPKQQQAASPPSQQQPAKPGSPANAQHVSNVSATPNTANGQPGTTPAKVPDADGSMLYTYPAPDSRSQRVSPVVFDALDAAFADKSGADAKHAYEKTKAKWTDDKQIGRRVDPNELMTGDVVIWDKRTALLVVFPPDEGGTVEAIVNGEKKPLADLMAAESSEFGEFLGFAHPAGIELSAAGNKDSSAAVVDPGSPVPAVTTA